MASQYQRAAPLPPPPPVYRYRRSLAGPLILIVIGGVFLLRNFGVHLPVWHFFGRFWPLRLSSSLRSIFAGGGAQISFD